MKSIKLLWVGKLKTRFWQDAAEHYWKNLARHYRLEQTIIKDANLPVEARVKSESQGILKALSPNDIPICLDERGKSLKSKELADLLRTLVQDRNRTPCFIIGGPYGFSSEVRDKARRVISLGPMTLPHELTRVLLLEQLFRAVSIIKNLPYHHE